MIEKNTTLTHFQKKITGYLDGTLTPEEKAEFEAYVRTNPQFEANIKNKEDELSLLKNLIPSAELSPEMAESLHQEMKQSVFNLLKEEPKNFWDKWKNVLEEWLTR